MLIVTTPNQRHPELRLRQLGPVSSSSPSGPSPREQASDSNANNNNSGPVTSTTTTTTTTTDGEIPPHRQLSVRSGIRLFEDPKKAFWRFSIAVPLESYEARWGYEIPGLQYVNGSEVKAPWNFVVPSVEQSMRIMFHSCNGFSVGTNMNEWVGPNLWKDVLRLHEQRPFHVMIGGGDQIYNDGIRVDGPLKRWTAIANPHKRRIHDFDNNMRVECDDYYFDNYAKWFSEEPFKTANGLIPQINVWDDHDIIDGFGSYTDHFMKCAVFRGIGGVAFKYYCLFQHHIPPPKSTFTTDAPQTMHSVGGTAGADPRQLENTFVLEDLPEDESWIIADRPGPYIEEKARHLYMRLGKRIAFLGLDARTERTRHQVNYPATYRDIFARLEREISAANGDIKHLILLLGVPIAYPRMAWLENILTSPIITPLRLLNKRFGLAGGFFNQFDGQVDLLDDLDDHYTAHQHKHERKEFMLRLQEFAQIHSIRVTILSGDVHLAAAGRFYSKVSLGIPAEHDHRYMVNVISSAITNKPPPKAVADIMSRRNKIHHLDHDTDETLMKVFDKQPGGKEKSASYNRVTMPSRNFACITEVDAAAAPPRAENETDASSSQQNSNNADANSGSNANADAGADSTATANADAGANTNANGDAGTGAGEAKNTNTNDNPSSKPPTPKRTRASQKTAKKSQKQAQKQPKDGQQKPVKDGHSPLHSGEEKAGALYGAADGVSSHSGVLGGLDVSFRVEIDPQNREGATAGYGFSSKFYPIFFLLVLLSFKGL